MGRRASDLLSSELHDVLDNNTFFFNYVLFYYLVIITYVLN